MPSRRWDPERGRPQRRGGKRGPARRGRSDGAGAGRVTHRLLVLLAVTAAALGLAVAIAFRPRPPAARGPILLRKVTRQSGIDFVHTDGSSGQRYIVETVTAGLALLDYDGDGLVDIYFLNGAPLRGARVDRPPENALYRNLGNWRFADVTHQAGVGDRGYGLGVAAGDYDNDGDPDLFVNNYGPNVLYRNNGDGTFTDVTDQAGVRGGNKVGAGASFLDADLDGDLDLYVANYVNFTYQTHVVHYQQGFPEYAGPRDYSGVPDLLYRNNGDGTFTDISRESGIGQHAGTGMGLVSSDYDNDGDADVFVLNDVAGNYFFRNDGTGRFEEIGVINGTAYNAFGDEVGSMGVDCGDYDNDGWLDFLMTSYQAELPVLYRNLGDGNFEDTTLASGIGEGSFAYVTWGVGLVDLDNDGDRDAFIACGHLHDNIDLYDDTTAYEVRNLVLMNTGGGRFVNVSDICGDGLLPKFSSRGAAFDDLDNDGDLDGVVLNSRRPATVLRNDSPGGRHWVQVRLEGTKANRDGVGARVRVVAGGRAQIAEVHSGRGYQSHYGMRLHFGLGPQERIERIEVHWMGGGVDIFHDLDADRLWTLAEGSGGLDEPGRPASGPR